jgi:hypothetical protein
MTTQEPTIATVNPMMPLRGQPNRFSFHIEINVKTTSVAARNVISRRLTALNVSSGCRCGMGVYAVLGSLIEGCFTRLLANVGRRV